MSKADSQKSNKQLVDILGEEEAEMSFARTIPFPFKALPTCIVHAPMFIVVLVTPYHYARLAHLSYKKNCDREKIEVRSGVTFYPWVDITKRDTWRIERNKTTTREVRSRMILLQQPMFHEC